MGCCNTKPELPKKTLEIRRLPIEETFIRHTEARLARELEKFLTDCMDGGSINKQLLEHKLEVQGLSLTSQPVRQLMDRIRTEDAIDLNKLIVSYLLVSEMPAPQKAASMADLAESSELTRVFVKWLIDALLEVACQVLPSLPATDSQMHDYPIHHYIKSLETVQAIVATELLNVLMGEATRVLKQDFLWTVTTATELEFALNSGGLRWTLWNRLKQTQAEQRVTRVLNHSSSTPVTLLKKQ